MAAARERWKILKTAILSAQRTEAVEPKSVSDASVRRFSSYGLFTVSRAEGFVEQDGVWMIYAPLPETDKTVTQSSKDWPAPLVRVITQCTSLKDMIGFNNTGNVCIWPSEEVLAYYCLKHAPLFRGCSVCELGCGMSALAGVMLASTQQPSVVTLTDGNRDSVENVAAIISQNRERFGATSVSSDILCWDESFLDVPTSHDGAFDWLICADCLFFTDLHRALVSTMFKLLRPGSGRVLLLAPGRSGSLEQFVHVAGEVFKVDREDRYDDVVSSKHEEQIRISSELYQPDLHYPVLLHLTPLT